MSRLDEAVEALRVDLAGLVEQVRKKGPVSPQDATVHSLRCAYVIAMSVGEGVAVLREIRDRLPAPAAEPMVTGTLAEPAAPTPAAESKAAPKKPKTKPRPNRK